MRTIFNFSLMLLLIFMISCGSSLKILEEPIEKKSLIIGSLIFDVNGYRNNFLTIRENVEVAIIGRVVQNGEIKTTGFWTVTDEDGDFYVANVPEGEYAIKGFRTHLIGVGDINIANELIDPQRNYYELNRRDIISFTGRLFDTKSKQKIINFKHNIFSLYPDEIVRFERLNRLRDVKLTTGEIINRLPVPVIFFERYEQSSWAKYLEMQIK